MLGILFFAFDLTCKCSLVFDCTSQCGLQMWDINAARVTRQDKAYKRVASL